ncbi:MAG TPA: hypothetical protein VHE37_16010 [Nevskiaceae bacterium]|nr:hypothetical protein [Nevskiaceae bacterium]
MSIGDAVNSLKDSAIAHALKGYINDRFGAYGEALDVEVDTRRNRIQLRALLKGETQPVTASIDRYDIERDEQYTYLVLHETSASREWLSVLLSKLAEGSRHKIPAAVAKFL